MVHTYHLSTYYNHKEKPGWLTNHSRLKIWITNFKYFLEVLNTVMRIDTYKGINPIFKNVRTMFDEEFQQSNYVNNYSYWLKRRIGHVP